MMDSYYFNSSLFQVEVKWEGDKATGIFINPAKQTEPSGSPPKEVKKFFEDLKSFTNGDNVEFTLPLDWSRLTGFAAKISRKLLETRPGDVLSYGELARRAGNEKASRAVGRVMASNPFPIVIPCHRVVGKDGNLTGYGPGLELKRQLLDLEKGMRRNG
jgi:methylated-DNA-[protein]-cysteine S-methyltransferase